jgi:hypothetical protein
MTGATKVVEEESQNLVKYPIQTELRVLRKLK